MAFPDDLIEQAYFLAKREPRRPRQASLRRAVSTAYYALFHLLVNEATLNWKRADQRATLARLFEHGKMRAASEACIRKLNPKPDKRGPSTLEQQLRLLVADVAEVFLHMQQHRHLADYDNAKQWTRSDVLGLINAVDNTLTDWRGVKDTPEAQDYLLSLLGNPRGK